MLAFRRLARMVLKNAPERKLGKQSHACGFNPTIKLSPYVAYGLRGIVIVFVGVSNAENFVRNLRKQDLDVEALIENGECQLKVIEQCMMLVRRGPDLRFAPSYRQPATADRRAKLAAAPPNSHQEQ